MRKTLAVIVEDKIDKDGNHYGNVVDCEATVEEAHKRASKILPAKTQYRIYYGEWEEQ